MCILGIEIEVVVHQRTKYGGKQTQYREVIGINNNYNFLLPEAVCCCLQTCKFCLMKTCYTVEPPIMHTPTSGQPPTNGQTPCPLPTTACTPYIHNLRRTDTSILRIMDKSHAPNCHCAYIITSNNGQRMCMCQLGFNY